MIVSVLIPTYRRPDHLAMCLAALSRQTRAADEVVVVHRADDTAALEALRDAPQVLPLKVVTVGRGGVIHAMDRGVAAAGGEAVAFVDDDAEPRPDWLGRIERHLAARPDVAGVGGLDQIRGQEPAASGPGPVVGRVAWYGRTAGNHHLGRGAAREADVLKGCNLALRRHLVEAVGFDERLRGAGAQVAWELALMLPMRRAGWRLIYDPAIVVDHHVAQRHDRDARDAFDPIARADAAHNEALAILDHLPPGRRAAFLAWVTAVGSPSKFGLAQALRHLPGRRRAVRAELRAAVRGRLAGWRTHRATRGQAPPVPAGPPRSEAAVTPRLTPAPLY